MKKSVAEFNFSDDHSFLFFIIYTVMFYLYITSRVHNWMSRENTSPSVLTASFLE